MKKKIAGGITYFMKKVAVLGLLFQAVWLYGKGTSLGVHFSDIILSGMKPGMVYSIKKEKGFPYRVTNKSAGDEDVEVTIEKPRGHQMKKGYEPIPDVRWIKVTPTSFRLKPGESTNCDVIISIPPGKEFEERHFQVMLVTQNIPKAHDIHGVAIAFALANRLRFSTGRTPEAVMTENRNKVLEVLKLDMAPLSLFLPETCSVGETVKLEGEIIPTIQLVNRSAEKYKVEFRLAKDPLIYGLTGEYQPMPEDIKVKFIKKKMTSKKRTIKDVGMVLEIPEKEELYGKKFAFVVIAQIKWMDIPVELFARVYFETAAKGGMKDEK